MSNRPTVEFHLNDFAQILEFGSLIKNPIFFFDPINIEICLFLAIIKGRTLYQELIKIATAQAFVRHVGIF